MLQNNLIKPRTDILLALSYSVFNHICTYPLTMTVCLHNSAKRPPPQVSICFALSVLTDSHGLKEPYSYHISVHMRRASEFD